MRVIIALVLTTVVTASLPIAAWAQPCRPGEQYVCKKKRPCYCQPPSTSAIPGGKAEIHKKNVPTVRPGRKPGQND